MQTDSWWDQGWSRVCKAGAVGGSQLCLPWFHPVSCSRFNVAGREVWGGPFCCLRREAGVPSRNPGYSPPSGELGLPEPVPWWVSFLSLVGLAGISCFFIRGFCWVRFSNWPQGGKNMG